MSTNLNEKVNEVLNEAKKVVFGQDELLDSIMAAMVCEGHVLIEGMPGLGKTLAVNTIGRLCDLSFQRIQFTPDLLPSDLIGTMIYSQKSEVFTTKFGPIFTQLLLADEINRSPAKVQSALLEGMGEKQVTIGENTHKLATPFVVLATQNPIDQEGTYPLPEAQMDRFMMKVNVGYPSFEAERSIMDLKKNALDDLEPKINAKGLQAIQENLDSIYVDEKIKKLIVEIIHATRPESPSFLKEFEGAILAGASPRGAIWLYKLSRFQAFLEESDFVTPEHILKIVPSVLGHRMILTYEAIIDKIKGRDVALRVANAVI
ncbi:MAG: AAA family ATPase [Deltaproteobacteria bacterium]|nr:MAG: AAA family ATPase [Deltaproteobacteria bacterium]